MTSEFLDAIERLAGTLRGKTFRAAARFVIEHKSRALIETGCYRGDPADGQSTLVLALLAKEVEGYLDSYELNTDPINHAMRLVESREGLYPAFVQFHQGDSVNSLSERDHKIHFAYLDSYDYEEPNFGPCQRHQLAELGAIYGKMQSPCAILLDDYLPKTGGKTALSAAFLKDRGWTLAAQGYQLLFTRT